MGWHVAGQGRAGQDRAQDRKGQDRKGQCRKWGSNIGLRWIGFVFGLGYVWVGMIGWGAGGLGDQTHCKEDLLPTEIPGVKG